jgi:hypothetical protein
MYFIIKAPEQYVFRCSDVKEWEERRGRGKTTEQID